MKREFLKELGIENDEVVQKIMDANGKDIEAAKKSAGSAKDTEVAELNKQLAQRDKDIQKLQKDLTDAQNDAGKLGEVSKSLTELQEKYNQEKTELEKKLSDQAYEFAVREKVNELQFTSKAAKEAFVANAISKQFKMHNGDLQGYTEFVAQYKTEDPGAFVAEKQPEPATPRIVAPTNPPAGKKMSLSEMMRQKNENPGMTIDF